MTVQCPVCGQVPDWWGEHEHEECVVCGSTRWAGSGAWVAHVDEDDALVCVGECWRRYRATKLVVEAEERWTALYRELLLEDRR